MRILEKQLKRVRFILILEKGVKLSRSISKQLKNLIEKTCFTNPNKRYTLSELINDPYILQLKSLQYIDNKEFLKSLNLNKKENKGCQLNDFKVENIAESILNKVENVIEYFSYLLGMKIIGVKSKIISNQKKPIENFLQNYNEMCIFLSLIYLELQELKNFINGTSFNEEFSELSLLKVNEKNYEYAIGNLFDEKISINLQNQKLDDYLKKIDEKREQLIYIINEVMKIKGKSFDDDKLFDNLSDLMKNFYHQETELFFFVLFDSANSLLDKGEFEKAYDEFLISKYYYEIILFIRMVSHGKMPNIKFIEASESLECEDFINIGNESKFSYNENNCLMITFLGSIFKIFKESKIIEEKLMTESTITVSKDVIEGLLSFATQLLVIISNCANRKS